MVAMDPAADANGGQYYGLEQSYGSDQLYGAESSAYGDSNGRLEYLRIFNRTCGNSENG